MVGVLDGAIELPTHGGHPWRQTWPHGLTLCTAAPAGESRGRRKGKKEGEKGVMWRLTGGAGLTATQARVCAGRRVRLRAVGLLLGRKWEQAGCEVGGQVSYLSNPYFLFDSNLNSNSNMKPLRQIQIRSNQNSNFSH
jgi:hypothetical protein